MMLGLSPGHLVQLLPVRGGEKSYRDRYFKGGDSGTDYTLKRASTKINSLRLVRLLWNAL